MEADGLDYWKIEHILLFDLSCASSIDIYFEIHF